MTSAVHDRMPVILDPDMELLKPYDAALMRCYPVSMRINRVANDGEDC
jgi:putative SOS response-associated peptidase YedK